MENRYSPSSAWTSNVLIDALAVHNPVYEAVSNRFVTLRCNTHVSDVGFVLLEFTSICRAVAIGFAVMGFIGYFVKLIHIPM
jgi:hypothetical protein